LERVLRHKPAELAGSVLDGKLGAIRLVGGRGRRIVLGVQKAGDRVTV
jgi:hypothetical protein